MGKSKPNIKGGIEIWATFRQEMIDEIVAESGENQSLEVKKDKGITDFFNKYEQRLERNLNLLPIDKKKILIDYWLFTIMLETEKEWDNMIFSNRGAILKHQYEVVQKWKERLEKQTMPSYHWKEDKFYMIPYVFLALERMGYLKSIDSSGGTIELVEAKLFTALGNLFPLINIAKNARAWMSSNACLRYDDETEELISEFTKDLGKAMSKIREEKRPKRKRKQIFKT